MQILCESFIPYTVVSGPEFRSLGIRNDFSGRELSFLSSQVPWIAISLQNKLLLKGQLRQNVLLTHVCVCVCVQLCPTLCNPMDYSPPGFSVHGIFSRQEYWRGLPFPSPGNLPDPGIELMSPVSPALQVDSLLLSHWGSPYREET